jgi:hypothetical protein
MSDRGLSRCRLRNKSENFSGDKMKKFLMRLYFTGLCYLLVGKPIREQEKFIREWWPKMSEDLVSVMLERLEHARQTGFKPAA